MNKPIRVAIVGCGRISDLHALGYQRQEDVRRDARIVAVCDTRRGRAAEKAKTWGVERIYNAYADLLMDPEVDLIELLVPTTYMRI